MLLRLTRWSASCLDTDVTTARSLLHQSAKEDRSSYEEVLLKHYDALFVAPVESHGYQDWIESVETNKGCDRFCQITVVHTLGVMHF